LKTRIIRIFAFAAVALTIVSCSRKKDNFINRSWHSVGTEYNILYNGNIALEQGKAALAEGYADNYWEILPVERLQVEDEISLPGQSKNADFERAEEKAVKAIQRHSMNIEGKEKNPQMDEAYILLGKARYFDQRFIPALEAFNYILFKYRASDKINQAKIWREKTNLRLENNELAITNLKLLLRTAFIDDQDLADATSTLAQAYINQQHLDSALTNIKIAANSTKNNDEKGRYRFIQAQLYNRLGYRDSANMVFDKIIDLKRKTPRIYRIAAYVGKAKNFDFENDDKAAFLELLTDLEEDRENRPYLDKIYHQIGEYHRSDESELLAVDYYNKSLRANANDKLLNAKNYQYLGDINFDNAQYKEAGAYYDSTLINLKQNSKEFRSIKRKRDNLADVIYYEDIATKNDSILNLVKMSEAERISYFSKYIDDLKIQAAKDEEQAQIEERNKAVSRGNNSSGNTVARGIGKNETENVFYFYNQTTVAFGKNEFIQSWGQRQLSDNWRWSDKGTSLAGIEEIDEALVNASEEELYDPNFYIGRIPSEQVAIDSLNRERNFAYYQLGLIYKDKFNENYLAMDKLEGLLQNDPEERLILPAKYNLYKVYQALNLDQQAEMAKNDIINQHPDSRYAAILLNPNVVLPEDENSPENLYEGLYRQFEEEHYEAVIEGADKYISMFDGEDIVPKYEYLKAVAKARLYGFESYKEALNFIALNYPNSPEGKKAEQMLQTTIPILANNTFKEDSTEKNFKLIFQFSNAAEDDITAFYEKLTKVTTKFGGLDLSTSTDFYNKSTKFVVVHGLNSLEGALGFAEILKERKDDKITKESFAISSPNYQIVQIHKNLDAYLNSQ